MLTGFLGSVRDLGSRLALVGLTLFVCALAPATALAADPTQHQYASSLDQIGTGGGGSASSAGPLPYTGLDVALLAGAAVALLVAGLLMRRQRPGAAGE